MKTSVITAPMPRFDWEKGEWVLPEGLFQGPKPPTNPCTTVVFSGENEPMSVPDEMRRWGYLPSKSWKDQSKRPSQHYRLRK